MADHPIIFAAESVRAILDGRKNQTKRVVKPQPPGRCEYLINGWGDHALCFAEGTANTPNPICVPPTAKSADHRLRCPYSVFDRLWVRETWNADWCDHVIYKADGGSAVEAGYPKEPRWRSPIHMPRWVSRITLEVTAVRVERLRDISEEDAKAEGLGGHVAGHGPVSEHGLLCEPGYWHPRFYRDGFAWHWDRINSKRPGCAWGDNPWVWAYTFRVLEAKR